MKRLVPARMIRLSTIGQVAVLIGGKPVPASNEQVIAALFYLVANRGKPVSRRAFAEMFFPAGDADAVAHSGRQLVYRLRKLRVSIEGDQATIGIPDADAAWDVDALLARNTASDAELAALQRGYLADYRPRVSDEFKRWLDDHRDSVSSRIRGLLVRQIQSARSRKDFRGLEPVAAACLALDPLNEEATLAAAESLAAAGAKADALELLDSYLEDVGGRSADLRIAPRLLRERVSAYTSDQESERVPLIGRAAELATISSLIAQSADRTSRACLVVGPGGIGKTRLLQEACSIAALSGHRIAQVLLSEHDADRPFAILRDLGPALLDLPGAIGAAPETLAAVRGLCGRGPSKYSRRPDNAYDARAVAIDVQRRVVDLVEAVTDEQPLIIWIEDADRMDEASRELVAELLNDGRRLCVLMAARRSVTISDELTSRQSVNRMNLGPLSRDDSDAFIAQLFRHARQPINGVFQENANRISAGVPLFLTLLFRNFLVTGDPIALPDTLSATLTARLDQQVEPAKSVFDAIVVLGSQSSEVLLEGVTELPAYALIQAIRSLDEAGFIRYVDDAVIPSHELLADAARRRMSPAVARILHRSAAKALEARGALAIDPLEIALHWQACGEHSQALVVVCRNASAYTALGRPREAIKLLQRARGLSGIPVYEVAIDEALLEAAHAAGEDHLGAASGDRLGLFSGSRSPESQLMAIEMSVGAGRPLHSFAGSLREIAGDRQSATGLRGRAARLLVMIAEDVCEKEAGTLALELIADIQVDTVETLVPKLIFQTVFGSTGEAVKLANQVEQSCRLVETAGRRLQGLSAATFALWRCGENDRAARMGNDAFEVASSACIWSACTTLGTIVGTIAWESGDLALAQQWIERTTALVRLSEGPDRGFQIASLAMSVAQTRKEFDKALTILEETERLYPGLRQERLQLSFLANSIEITLGLGLVPDADEVNELLKGHLERRHLGLHDPIAEATIGALRSSGREGEANELRRVYLAQYRKERSPVSAVYARLAGN